MYFDTSRDQNIRPTEAVWLRCVFIHCEPENNWTDIYIHTYKWKD